MLGGVGAAFQLLPAKEGPQIFLTVAALQPLRARSCRVPEASHQLHRVPKAQESEAQKQRQGSQQGVVLVDLGCLRTLCVLPDLDPKVSPGQHAAEQLCGSLPDCGTGGQRVVEGRVIEQGDDLPRPSWTLSFSISAGG